MDELISRQAAIDLWEKYHHTIAVDAMQYDAELRRLPSAQLGTNLAEVGTDCISRQAAIDALEREKSLVERPITETRWFDFGLRKAQDVLSEVPSAQPERTCVNCGRTANNGGWYADGRTRCPIEEHYALPKDGYCHLWEKRNVTDDDYPERREE